MKKLDEFLGCPYCGGQPVMYAWCVSDYWPETKKGPIKLYRARLDCVSCGISMSGKSVKATDILMGFKWAKMEVIKKWNKRFLQIPKNDSDNILKIGISMEANFLNGKDSLLDNISNIALLTENRNLCNIHIKTERMIDIDAHPPLVPCNDFGFTNEDLVSYCSLTTSRKDIRKTIASTIESWLRTTGKEYAQIIPEHTMDKKVFMQIFYKPNILPNFIQVTDEIIKLNGE